MPDIRNGSMALVGFVTFLSFATFGAVPLVPCATTEPSSTTYILTVSSTFSALVALGILR